jgi:hypothetical protein
MNLIGHADKAILMKLIKEEEEAAGGNLNRSVTSPALYASGQVSPRRRASPSRKNESESESEYDDEEESEDGTDPARTRKQVRIIEVDSDQGFRPQPEEGDAKNERGKNEDEEAVRRSDEDDNEDGYEVLHGDDVTRMPLAKTKQKRSKSTGLLNALGKRAGANRVDLNDHNMLALLPTPPERTNTFQPIASTAYLPHICS